MAGHEVSRNQDRTFTSFELAYLVLSYGFVVAARYSARRVPDMDNFAAAYFSVVPAFGTVRNDFK
eukprot:3259847-Pleurochrysis_carterae.AAC.1